MHSLSCPRSSNFNGDPPVGIWTTAPRGRPPPSWLGVCPTSRGATFASLGLTVGATPDGPQVQEHLAASGTARLASGSIDFPGLPDAYRRRAMFHSCSLERAALGPAASKYMNTRTVYRRGWTTVN